MIFRAVFWIAVVAVFMPHEPDLGFGRPGAQVFPPTKFADWTPAKIKAPGTPCEGRQALCAGGLILADDLRNTILSNLDRVKTDLKQSAQGRLESGRQSQIGGRLLAHLPHL